MKTDPFVLRVLTAILLCACIPVSLLAACGAGDAAQTQGAGAPPSPAATPYGTPAEPTPTAAPAATPEPTEPTEPPAVTMPPAQVSPSPSPETTDQPPSPTPDPGPDPEYSGVALYDEPEQGKLSIGVSPTVIGPKRKYYVPGAAEQKKLRKLLEQDSDAFMERGGGQTPLGMTIDDRFLADNGSELSRYVKKLVYGKCNMSDLDPKQIRGVVSARLSYNTSGVKGVQVITDPAKLKHLEDRLSIATVMESGTSCPFYESILTLQCKNGSSATIRLATDGCQVYFHDGKYYDYSPDHSADSPWSGMDILELFDQVPWAVLQA